MTEIWVYKPDGTIQCVPTSETEIPLAKMREQLEALIGKGNVLAEEKRHPAGPVPAVCGRPTGNLNAYKITSAGLQLLFSGVAGPSGFEVDPATRILGPGEDGPVNPWPMGETSDSAVFPWPTKAGLWGDDRWAPWPWVAMAAQDAEAAARAFTNVVASLTKVGANPTTVAELIGRVVRVYNEGDMVHLDYSPQRINIVLDAGRISRIWFG